MRVVTKAMAASAVVMIFSLMSSAQVAAQQAGSKPQRVENMEALLDNLGRYNG